MKGGKKYPGSCDAELRECQPDSGGALPNAGRAVTAKTDRKSRSLEDQRVRNTQVNNQFIHDEHLVMLHARSLNWFLKYIDVYLLKDLCFRSKSNKIACHDFYEKCDLTFGTCSEFVYCLKIM